MTFEDRPIQRFWFLETVARYSSDAAWTICRREQTKPSIGPGSKNDNFIGASIGTFHEMFGEEGAFPAPARVHTTTWALNREL